MNWQEFPFLRLAVPLAAGIWLYDRFPATGFWTALPALFAAAFFLLAFWQQFPLRFDHNFWFGALLLLLTTGLGIFAAGQADVSRSSLHLNKLERTADWTAGLVREKQDMGGRTRVVLQIKAVAARQTGWRPACGRLLVYLPDSVGAIRRDDTLLLAGRLHRLEQPRNPEAFDFARYMELSGVTHQIFVRPGNFLVSPHTGPETYRRRIDGIRDWCLGVLRRHLRDSSSFSVGAAVTLGFRGTLDVELRDAYAASGAMHVLSVSGLHVGLVYLGLSFLSPGRTGKRKWIRFWLAALQLAGVWMFVLLAGLPPSGVRAAAMCSFFIVGRTWNREAHILNTLAASAFCILLFQPFLLFDTGFQLSYAAVAGIVILEPGIYRFWQAPGRLGDYLWKLLTVSLAAQLATFPLGLYYFQQFPVYFWLSGFIAVPASSLMLGGGLILLVLDAVPVLGAGLGCLLDWLIIITNGWIMWIGDLPASRLTGLWIDAWTAAALYALLGLTMVTCYERRGAYWLGLLALSLMMILLRAERCWRMAGQRQLVVYYIHQHTLIDLLDGQTAFSLADEEAPPQALLRAAQSYRWSRGIRRVEQVFYRNTFFGETWKLRAGLLQFHHYRLLIVDSHTGLQHLPPLKVDGLLIRGDPLLKMEDLLDRITAGIIISDASNSPYRSSRWRDICAGRRQPFHDVRSKGAIVLEFQKNRH